MTTLKLAQFHDVIEDTDKLIISLGRPMFDSARDELHRYVAAEHFKREGSEWISAESRQTLVEFFEDYVSTHEHCFADTRQPGEEELEANEIESAMLNPTPDKLGKLVRKLGKVRFEKICSDWTLNPASMNRAGKINPGVRPGYSKETEKKADDDGTGPSTNPWHPKFKGDRITAQQRIIKTGTKFAIALAKSAGVTLSGTPLRK